MGIRMRCPHPGHEWPFSDPAPSDGSLLQVVDLRLQLVLRM
jgi:hypothetical protein